MKKLKMLILSLSALCAAFVMTSCKPKECEHEWGQGTVSTAATHTTEGVMKYTCDKCGEEKTEAIAATGHDTVTEWTKDENKHWHLCSCGAKLDEAAHTWNEGVITTEPTHTTQGVKTFTCLCGATKTEDVAAIGHDTVTEWSNNEEKHWHECSCGAKLDEAAHTWDEGVVTKAPNCTEKGEKTFTCTVCGANKIEEVPANGHTTPTGLTKQTIEFTFDYPEGFDAIATKEALQAGLGLPEGFVVNVTNISGGLYSFSNGGSGATSFRYDHLLKLGSGSKDGSVEFTFAEEAKVVKVVVTGLANKTGNNIYVNGTGKTTTALMALNPVYEILEFELETAVNKITVSVDAKKAFTIKTIEVYVEGGVQAVKENVVAADCEHAGSYDEVVRCSVCNEVVSTNHVVIPTVGHDYKEIEEVPATCTTDGVKGHYVCEVCNKLFTKEGDVYTEVTEQDLVISAGSGEHNWENKEGKAPSCTEEGYTAYQECSRCHQEKGKEVIPATGHTVPDEFTYIELNETIDGVKTYYWVKDFTCPVCSVEHCQIRTDEVVWCSDNYTKGYKTFEDALKNATPGEEFTITLFKDAEVPGIFIGADQNLNIVINLNRKTLTVVSPAVGSYGTETQAFHFEKGNTIIIKNGTIVTPYEEKVEGKKVVKMGIQNYCNLTLDSVVYDATTNTNIIYAVSNNFGSCTINNCDIKGVKVLDCWYSTGTYEDGVKVVVKGTTKLTGVVEYGANNEVEGWMKKATLDLSGAIKGNLAIEVVASSNGFTFEVAIEEGGIKLPSGVDTIYNGELHTHKVADNETAKVVLSEKGYANSTVVSEVSISETVKVIFAKGTGTNDPKYYTSGTAVRVYGGNTIKIANTANGMKITSIVFKFSSGEGSNAITCNVGEFAGNTWVGSSDEVTFTIGGTSGHRRIAEIEVILSEPAVTEQINHEDATCCNPESYDEVTKCQICGAIVSTKHVVVENSQLQHQYGELIAEVAANCENDGVKAHYECASCKKLFTKEDEVYTEVTEKDLVIKALGHEYVSIAKEATCTEDGFVENAYKCSVCNKYFVKNGDVYVEKTLDEVTVKSTGKEHPEEKFIKVDAVAPTCTTGGNNEYYHCECCGKYYKADKVTETTVEAETLPSLEGAHNFSINVEAKDPSCTEIGWTAHKECSICHAKNDEYQVREILPHTKPQSGEFVYVKVEDKWYKQYLCAECETTFVEETNEVVVVIGENGFASVKDAFASITTTEEVTITMIKDSQSGGIFAEQNKGYNVTIDLGGYTLTVVSPAVGSNGTETQAFHLEKGNTITIKNGTIVTPYEEKVEGKKVVKMGFQNYCNLTLNGIEYDISENTNITYALSNCNGSLLLKDCLIITNENQVVFDAWFTVGYPDGVTVTVTGDTMLDGVIEYGAQEAAATADPNWIEKTCIVLTNADADNLDVVIETSSKNFELKDANILLPNGVDCLIDGVFHTHNYVEHEGLEATCTTKGHTAYTLCECGVYGVEKVETEIDPNNHDLDENLVCTRCGKHFKEEWVVVSSLDQIHDGVEIRIGASNYFAANFNSTLFVGTTNANEAKIFTLKESETSGKWYLIVDGKYVNCNTSGGNKLSLSTNKYDWELSVANNNLVIKTGDHKIQWNSGSSDKRFTNYSSNQTAIIVEAKTITEKVQYNVTVNSGENFTTTLTNHVVLEGTTVEFTVTPVGNYLVDAVKIGEEELVAIQGVYSFVVTGNTDVVITMLDASVQYTVSLAAAVENATVTGIEYGTPVACNAGSTFEFTVIPAEGYKAVVKANCVELEEGTEHTYSFEVIDNTVITIEISVAKTQKTLIIDCSKTALATTAKTAGSLDTITVDSIELKVADSYKNSNPYWMFVEKKGFAYNTTDLGSIKSISVQYSTGTSTSGQIAVVVGNSVLSTKTTVTHTTIAGQGKTETFTFEGENGFFQISTANKNVQIVTIVIVYEA